MSGSNAGQRFFANKATNPPLSAAKPAFYPLISSSQNHLPAWQFLIENFSKF